MITMREYEKIRRTFDLDYIEIEHMDFHVRITFKRIGYTSQYAMDAREYDRLFASPSRRTQEALDIMTNIFESMIEDLNRQTGDMRGYDYAIG